MEFKLNSLSQLVGHILRTNSNQISFERAINILNMTSTSKTNVPADYSGYLKTIAWLVDHSHVVITYVRENSPMFVPPIYFVWALSLPSSSIPVLNTPTHFQGILPHCDCLSYD